MTIERGTTKTTVSFSVPGPPVGKGRPRFARRGNHIATYTPEKTASYENLVKVKAQEAMSGEPPFETSAVLYASLFVVPPASWSKKKREKALMWDIDPTSKPDIDNVLKCLCDSMNGIVFRDDKQVCEVHICKRYDNAARADVKVVFSHVV
jgi:Holliday junction resolvase RusA-like endonuclease